MPDFQAIHTKTMGNEGGYANNPNDAGGETYKGIARKMWPKWAGWKYIDGVKALTTTMPHYGTEAYHKWAKYLDGKLAGFNQLQRAVVDFYKKNFWDAYRLDQISSAAVAAWIYDHVVNAGTRGIIWAQLAVNTKPDGNMGPVTIGRINIEAPESLLARMEDISGAYRLDKAHDNPSQIQFLTSWLKRDGQPDSVIEHVRQAARDGRLDDREVAALKVEMTATT